MLRVPPPSFGKGTGIASRIAAVALVAVAVEMVVSRVDEERKIETPAGVDEPSEIRTVGEHCDHPDSGRIWVVLTASRVRPQERVLVADVGVCPSARAREALLTADRRSVIATDALRAGLEDHPVTLVVSGVVPEGEAAVATTMGELFGTGRSALVRLEQISVPLEGQPDRYPFDWYSFEGYARLVFGPGITVPDAMKGPTEDPDPSVLPVHLRLLTAPGVGDFRFRDAHVTAPSGIAQPAPVLVFDVEREGSTRRFVVVILLVPVLFAALFAVLLAQPHVQASSGLRDLLLGMVAATVALLPIRQVLVPADVEGLTVVDWWLGSTILLFVAISLWAIPSALQTGSASAATTAGAQPVTTAAPWALLFLLVACLVPIALVAAHDSMPSTTAGGLGLLVVMGACLVGALGMARSVHRRDLEGLARNRRPAVIAGAAAAILALPVVAWLVVLALGWALGGERPF